MKAQFTNEFKLDVFRNWMKKASVTEQQKLAELANVSHRFLYNLSCGARNASSVVAGRIEEAAKKVREDNKKLPVLKRYDISPECSNCPYALRCKPQNPKA